MKWIGIMAVHWTSDLKILSLIRNPIGYHNLFLITGVSVMFSKERQLFHRHAKLFDLILFIFIRKMFS